MAAKKEKTRAEKARKVIKELDKLRRMPKIKAPAKKKVAPEKESLVSKVGKKLRAVFYGDKKKPVTTMGRTRAIKRQMGTAAKGIKTDYEKETAKKAKGSSHNSHGSSKGGY